MIEQFSFRGLRGPKADVIAKVQAGEASAEAKSFLIGLINARPCEGVTLDCHAASAHGHDISLHVHIGKLY